ncbi:class I SAM-dependent methyltransferase [Nocardioides nanhaiensis]|uniref:Class I SAM-dependent methyltransferase n=1 Tax=Nocardioides nanhaiensis TaxID=1476871 RepID=A0ABP8WQJ7_9ACTN
MAERRGAPALPGLDSQTYARAHLAFESRSDQRRLIAEHLAGRLAARAGQSISVLSVGCGDGTLDVPLIQGLLGADGARSVRYVGVDPYETATTELARAMGALDDPALQVETHSTTWESAPVSGTFDVITFVHSMYYVPDVAAAVAKACSLLRPGGELVVLSGPRGAMNTLVDICAPPIDGHPQWFSDDVAAGIAEAAAPAHLEVAPVERLEALLALEPVTHDVLDFVVQARLTPEARELVLACLRSAAVPDPASGRFEVPHPVDVHRVVRLP